MYFLKQKHHESEVKWSDAANPPPKVGLKPPSSSDEPDNSALPADPERRVRSLRQQLLLTVLPTMLVPVAIAGTVGYSLAQKQAEQQIQRQLQSQVLITRDNTRQVLQSLSQMTQAIATNPLLLEDAKAGSQAVERGDLNQRTVAELQEELGDTRLLRVHTTLNDYLQSTAAANGLGAVVVTEQYGFNIAASEPPNQINQSQEIWWQQGKSQNPWIGLPKSDPIATFELAQALQDPKSGNFLGVMKTTVPISLLSSMSTTLQIGLSGSQTVQLMDPSSAQVIQTFTAEGSQSDRPLMGGKPVEQVAAALVQSVQGQTEIQTELQQLAEQYRLQQMSVTALEDGALLARFGDQQQHYAIATIPGLDWVAVAAVDQADTQAVGQQMLTALLFMLLAVAIAMGGLTWLIAQRIVRPLQSLTHTTHEVIQGNLNARVPVQGPAEMQALAQSFNQLMGWMKTFLQEQVIHTEKARLLAGVNSAVDISSPTLAPMFEQTVEGVRNLLQADRVVLYRFNTEDTGPKDSQIIIESVAAEWPSVARTQAELIPQVLLTAETDPALLVTSDFSQTELLPTEIDHLKRLGVKANLAVLVQAKGQRFGVLRVDHCKAAHIWQPSEIDFCQQIANQLGFAIERVKLFEQTEQQAEVQRQLKEAFQQRALTLLQEVNPIIQGDLTIRATVTADEIGTIADTYNATVDSLRKIVMQVQQATQQVTTAAHSNEASLQALLTETLHQSEGISTALAQVEAMASVMQGVAVNAEQAAIAVQKATGAVAAGDSAMNRTVEGIQTIRTTVAETAKKVKHLGESSQRISAVVNLLDEFAEQTKMLSLNASIEAALAGEQGRGFSMVAEEVRALARKSAEATDNIRTLVAEIQAETNEVVTAMEAGTEQVVIGTKLVDETRQHLNQITVTSAEVGQLIDAIAQTSTVQSQTSTTTIRTMTDVVAIATKTSAGATQVAAAFEQLRQVAQALQESVGQFKVEQSHGD